MILSELFKTKRYLTDKNSVHSYIDNVYDQLFVNRQNTTNVLEIGVYDGGSILLWRDYFLNATIDAIDINDCSDKLDNDRINHIVGDAYNVNLVKNLSHYDIIIDDGPHTIESMIFVVEHYLSLLKPDGVCVIEDVQFDDWFKFLIDKIPQGFTYEIIDIRHIKNRYDDMLLIIRRTQ